ncbi:MAG: hypothetical protein HUU02_15415 [Bacteroidetes bacterium]|nr:hypothetical protein [Bacteroidota bacterium]
MTAHEEVIHDGTFRSLSDRQQSELIGRYCAPVMERLSHITERSDAVRAIDAACAEFDAQCHSMLVRQAVRRRMDALLIERWGDA